VKAATKSRRGGEGDRERKERARAPEWWYGGWGALATRAGMGLDHLFAGEVTSPVVPWAVMNDPETAYVVLSYILYSFSSNKS
jgi:hypothetical protein